jgi:hypothetical protein
VAARDTETHGPSLLGLGGGGPLELRQVLKADSRVRLRVRLPGPGTARCSFRQDGRERWWLRWEHGDGNSSFLSEADGREIPLVEIPDRKPLEWVSLDLRLRQGEIDLSVDGKLRGIAPLKEPLGGVHLVLEVPGGGLAQFADIWITELH